MKKIMTVIVSLLLMCGCNSVISEGSNATDTQFKDSDLDASYSGSTELVLANEDVYITEEGTYTLSGELKGSVIVNVADDEEVQLVLDNITIDSSDFAVIYVKEADKVTITMTEGSVNTLSDESTYTQIDAEDVDAVIFSKADLVINGNGTLNINANYKNGIVSKDDLTISGGTYNIKAVNHGICGKDCLKIADGTFKLICGGDGLKSDNEEDADRGYVYIQNGTFSITSDDDAIQGIRYVTIDGGSFDITAHEGIEGTYIKINGGNINISASDDGINAAQKVTGITPTFEMNDGSLTIVMGQGDTDAIDANGSIYVNGGTIDITAQSPFDYDMTAEYNGGTIIINGQETDTITNQFGGQAGTGGMPGAGFDPGSFDPGDFNGNGEPPAAPGGMGPGKGPF
ncbi:MAG: carbohydrate-binding domain-containing protein [Erysipelotrichaceae bacterium]|nr:carbohydrate-binding domain-containing protein [Erysipelotrichaceae bacterium]